MSNSGSGGQQRVDSVDEDSGQEPMEIWGSPADDAVAAKSEPAEENQESVAAMSEELQATVERAITVLEEVDPEES